MELMSSATKIFPNASTCTPPRAAAPKIPFTARQPSPNASVDTAPVIAFSVGHGVPATGVIGEVPAIVDMVSGMGRGVCCAAAVSEKIEKMAERKNTNLTTGADRGMEASGYEGMRNI